jgi:hypothetical protein
MAGAHARAAGEDLSATNSAIVAMEVGKPTVVTAYVKTGEKKKTMGMGGHFQSFVATELMWIGHLVFHVCKRGKNVALRHIEGKKIFPTMKVVIRESRSIIRLSATVFLK